MSAAPRAAGAFALSVLLAMFAPSVPADAGADSSSPHRPGRTADAPARTAPARVRGPHAPTGPPLTAGARAPGERVEGETAAGEAQAQADPLVSNGLGSPLCSPPLAGGPLPAGYLRNCETSGFIAAAAPTADYGIDVHIDTGLFGLSSGGLLSAVQDLVITPVWMAVVWVVHALVVMLEWCFTLDLLDSASAGGLGAGLRQMQAAITQPWLAIALSIASVLVLYDGLLRRRVAETLGQALQMLVMIVGGMWVILDPTGTVGALGRWANSASVGTLAVAATGSPARPPEALAASMNSVFAAAVEGPWCYLEFGDVDWCRSSTRLDSRLRTAGLGIARELGAQSSCSSPLPASCPAAAGAGARGLASSAALLRSARTNGELFLALPANGPARNSINDGGSLLHAICASSDATRCAGDTAAQAEFRTNSGTWSRMGGLLLIVAGVTGMMLTLGAIALRLLAAAVFSIVYLLLAPGMVLAPALGDGGRAVFKNWAAKLLGAVTAKLLFSFVLGVMLAVLAVLSRLSQLGWWTQWLLMSAFWWSAFLHRHTALGVLGGALGREVPGTSRTTLRRVSDVLETRKAAAMAGWLKGRRERPAAPPPRGGGPYAQAPSASKGLSRDPQAARLGHAERLEARGRAQSAGETRARLGSRRAQLERIGREQVRAHGAGDKRRSAELGHRAGRVAGEMAEELSRLNGTRSAGAPDAGGGRGELELRRRRFLDEQAALPAAVESRRSAADRGSVRRRDYAALAGLAGYGRLQYERLEPKRKRVARLEVDRQLAMRRRLADVAVRSGGGRETAPTRAGYPRARPQRSQSALPRPSLAPVRKSADRTEPRTQREAARREGPGSVMRDAREVEARRKRQLGHGMD